MKILFSPSEAKSDISGSISFSDKSLSFPRNFEDRLSILKKFTDFLNNATLPELQKVFGIKDEKECTKLQQLNLFSSSTCKAIQRYTGVAYKYLNFDTLSQENQNWIYDNTLIFSNLFGPILAKDEIPYYKFKQGSTINGLKPELFYKEKFTDAIDHYIGNDLIIDLRAGFYEKFYTIKKEHITMKFIKNGKVVSHWAKAYRGIVLRELAKYQPNTIEEFENINFSALNIEEIIEKKLKKEYVFKISE
ncbi:YaaA family protein [Sulfurospirillum arcachonense]|uniref:YaaA family protein n=1 Tax=Sulfurospirillum arcachonense TaxID=57666 RepID=UPI00046AE880|nr:YaaA family protein [Sulfurospirillum arcachonense]